MFTEGAGFITIVAGTFLLHTTRDMDVSVSDLSRLAKDTQTLISVSSMKADKREMQPLYSTDTESEPRGRPGPAATRR
jgi:magnesium transporter